MEHATSARGLPGTDYQWEVRQQKIDLNYSTTRGISRAGPALKTLIVCINQVEMCPPCSGVGRASIPLLRRKRTGGWRSMVHPDGVTFTACHAASPRSR